MREFHRSNEHKQERRHRRSQSASRKNKNSGSAEYKGHKSIAKIWTRSLSGAMVGAAMRTSAATVHLLTQKVKDGAVNRVYQMYIGVSSPRASQATCHPFKAILHFGWQTTGKQLADVFAVSKNAYTKRCIQVETATTYRAAHVLVQL